MTGGHVSLAPGTLWDQIVQRTRSAIRRGALHSILTDERYVKEDGVRFLVRVVSSLAGKEADRSRQTVQSQELGVAVNPFLPYDETLFVTDLSDTHVCLLNKFNVIDHHLLMVTREFEHQETLLSLADFEALWACMAEFEGLGFYNGGTVAGASQPHKHLQMVPLPLAFEGPAIPIDVLLEKATSAGTIGTVPGFPFRHAFARLDPRVVKEPLVAAAAAYERYHAMLAAVGLEGAEAGDGIRQSAPYNLLVARDWILLVPRSKEYFQSVPVNALGYAGSFFVRDEARMRVIERHRPMTVLRGLAIATD